MFGDVGVPVEDWTGEYEWLLSLDCVHALVMLTPDGWFLVCATCEVAVRVGADPEAAEVAAAHNVGAVHGRARVRSSARAWSKRASM